MKARPSGWGSLAECCLILLLAACAIGKPAPMPTATPSPTHPVIPTATTPPTETRTPRPTVTLWPSDTPTLTETPFFTSTPTASETPAPQRLAQLFTFHDAEGTLIDWSYARLSSVKLNNSGQVKSLSAFLAFQLTDRAIHRTTIKLFGDEITYYYLNTRHQFGTELAPMALIIGATYGKNIAIQNIPAGGSSYTLVRRMGLADRFDALGIHYQVNLPISLRKDIYQDMPLLELQALLAGLPDEVIVLAEHPVLVDSDGYQQLYNDITSVAYLAARYTPFIQIDANDRIAGPTPAALALKAYLLYGTLPSAPVTAYSSDVLILLTRP